MSTTRNDIFLLVETDRNGVHMVMYKPSYADHVHSLCRPQTLIEANTAPLAKLAGCQSLMQAMQERIGLRAITDGQLRRSNWRRGLSQQKIASGLARSRFFLDEQECKLAYRGEDL